MTKKKQTRSKKTTTGSLTNELLLSNISPDERRHMISEAAYYKAEQRGFDPLGCESDWLEAESMVDEMLNRVVEEQVEA